MFMTAVVLFFKYNLFIYLFILAVLGLCCCVGFSLVVVCGLLIAVASPVAEYRLLEHMGFSSCSSPTLDHRLGSYGSQAWLVCSMWDQPGPGMEPVSPALAGRFFTSEAPGEPRTRAVF